MRFKQIIPMKRDWLESFLLSMFLILLSYSCTRRSKSAYLFILTLWLLFFVALFLEWTRCSKYLKLLLPRSTGTPGLSIGVIVIPALFIAQLGHAPDPTVESTTFRLWASLASGYGLMGSTFALRHNKRGLITKQRRSPSTSRSLTAKPLQGTDHESDGGSQAEDSVQEDEGKGRSHGFRLVTTWLAGWFIGSIGIVFLAGTSWDWLGGGWLGTHSMFCASVNVYLLRSFPGSLTAGESFVLSETLTLYGLDALGSTLHAVFPKFVVPTGGTSLLVGNSNDIDAVIQGMVLGILLLPFLWKLIFEFILWTMEQFTMLEVKSWLEDVSYWISFYCSLLLQVSVIVPFWLCAVMGLKSHPFVWTVEQVMEQPLSRLSLCIYWLLVLIIPLGKLRDLASRRQVAHIILRKAYHFMAVAMFVPAMLFQTGFMRLSFGVGLVCLLIVEVIRIEKIPPFGAIIDSFMKAFVDSRDSGIVIISHFSLLIGCAFPLWLRQPHEMIALPAFAGILSIGIGDTMASIFGYNYGKIRISIDSKKTVEGTLAGILSMSVAILLVAPFLPHPPHGFGQWSTIIVATVVAGLLEATTNQLDNIFVPLVYYTLLSLK